MFDFKEQCLLINAVRNRPYLYNIRMKKNLSCRERHKLWKEVSDIMHLDVVACKSRWKTMRDRYIKIKKEMKTMESGVATEKKPWPLFHYLTFLEDPLNLDSNINRIICNSSSELQQSLQNIDSNEETPICDTSSLRVYQPETDTCPLDVSTPNSHSLPYSHENEEIDPITYCTSSLNCRSSRKRKSSDDIKTIIVKQCLKNSALLKKLDNENIYDEDKHFLLSLLGPMKKLDEDKKMDFKLEVYTLLKNKQSC